jgi:membrane-associated phospholipid phosphatase
VLLPLTVAATIVLLAPKRRFEALLLATSVTAPAAVAYTVKLTGWPSATGAVGNAVVLREVALAVALVWIVLASGSRWVLGVHWPTDVLAAVCVRATPLALRCRRVIPW